MQTVVSPYFPPQVGGSAMLLANPHQNSFMGFMNTIF